MDAQVMAAVVTSAGTGAVALLGIGGTLIAQRVAWHRSHMGQRDLALIQERREAYTAFLHAALEYQRAAITFHEGLLSRADLGQEMPETKFVPADGLRFQLGVTLTALRLLAPRTVVCSAEAWSRDLRSDRFFTAMGWPGGDGIRRGLHDDFINAARVDLDVSRE
ncbi:hypothetical protein [Actinopolymorpha rutila]|uniref:Uncharacterized protein n=1 Tax=Actinopolymorpha rutila TaxID=446787 RepID=A0A852Z7P9_9ACTN|nr:hypothetical protein [Actinopolymorpha rutila]NYH88245.1 hypothetical protein [Actinopolymorpha rutila]